MASGCAIGRKAGDIFGDCAGQKLDVLRQIANMLAERFGRPLVVGRSVETDFAARRLPDADEHARQARLAGAARANNAEAAAGFQRKIDVVATSLWTPGGATLAVSTARSCRRLKRHGLGLLGKQRQQLVERMPALPGRDKSLPVARWRGRPAQARARSGSNRNDDAGGCLLIDHKIGANREHGRLQHHAQHF